MTPSGGANATQAVQRLLAEFGPRLRAIVLACGPAECGLDPDAVQQEVHVRLRQTLEREEGIAHPASCLYRVAMSVIVEHLRRRDARPGLDVGDVIEGFAWVPANAIDDRHAVAAGNAGLARRLTVVLQALPERRRWPVQLHLQGFGDAEVARLLGLSDAAARDLVQRGMDDVRRRLHAQGWP